MQLIKELIVQFLNPVLSAQTFVTCLVIWVIYIKDFQYTTFLCFENGSNKKLFQNNKTEIQNRY